MSNVVGLNGRAPPAPSGAEPDVIAALEELLEDARAGNISAVGVVMVRPNGEIGTRTRNPGRFRHQLVAGAAYLMNDIISAETAPD